MSQAARHPLIVLLLAALFSVPAAADFTASGTFQYEDRPFNIDGFTGEQAFLPIRHADVEVVDLLTQTVIGAGRTDNSGTFQVDVALSVPRTLYVRCLTDTANHPLINLQVKDDIQDQAVYAVAGPSVAYHDPWSALECGTLTAGADGAGGAFNIFDAAIKSLDYYYYLSGGYPGPAWSLTLFWRDGAGETSSWYDRVYRQVIMADNAVYDDSVILHETGHYIQSAFALCQNPGGSHYVTDMNQDRYLAFSEGWATFYASAVRLYHQEPGAQIFVRTTGGDGAGNLDFSFNLEGPSLPVFGSFNELAVSACFWDLVDHVRKQDGVFQLDDDVLAGTDLLVWTVMSDLLPAAGEATMESFWNGWVSTGPDQLSGSQAIFSTLGMEYLADTWEPEDDEVAGAMELSLVEPQPQPLVEINEMSLGAVDWLELYNSGGTAVDLEGWTVQAGRSGGSTAEIILPAFTLYPHHFVALFEGEGADSVDRIFLPGTNIPWVTDGAGFCALLDNTGAGIDFCRWGGAAESPPAGTAWYGSDSPLPCSGMNLGRNSAGSDTDQGSDFTSVAPTASGPNWEPGGGQHHHSFYPAGDRDWLSIEAQAGQRYDLEVFNRCSGAAASMTLYAPDGITALFSESCDGSFGSGPRRAWVAPADGTYLLNLINSGQLGEYGSYDIQATAIPVTAPAAAALSPAVLGVGVSCPLTLTGDGFVPGLRAWFSSPGIVCQRVEVLDRSTAVLLVRASPATASGSHDLLLRGPDGSETLLTGALQLDPARGSVVINELNVLENWVELRNCGDVALDLTGWELQVAAGRNSVSAVLPSASIGPGSFLTIYDLGTPGENGPAEIHLDQFFGWLGGIYGSCALVDAQPAGRDFVRWDGDTGSSLDQPPSGTGWRGPNPAMVSGYYSLGRDQAGSDTDAGCDFSAQESSPGQVNTAQAALDALIGQQQLCWFAEDPSLQLEAVGGEPPYRWFLTNGLLPPGISLSETGRLEGAATALGWWPVIISAQDAAGRIDSGELLLEIQSGLTASIQPQPAVASFPCNVDLKLDLFNQRTRDAVVEAELTAAGAPPEGTVTYEIAHNTLVLPPGPATYYNLTYYIPASPQFHSGIVFKLTLRDAATGTLLGSSQCQVENQQLQSH